MELAYEVRTIERNGLVGNVLVHLALMPGLNSPGRLV